MQSRTPQQADNDVGLALRPTRQDGLKGGDAHVGPNAKVRQRSPTTGSDTSLAFKFSVIMRRFQAGLRCLDCLGLGPVLILNIPLPEPPRTHNPAVVTCAVISVFVVPPMPPAHRLAVFFLVGNTKVDEDPRQVSANPCAPAKRMIWIPIAHTMLKQTNELSDCRRKRKVERERHDRIAATRQAKWRGESSSLASGSAVPSCQPANNQHENADDPTRNPNINKLSFCATSSPIASDIMQNSSDASGHELIEDKRRAWSALLCRLKVHQPQNACQSKAEGKQPSQNGNDCQQFCHFAEVNSATWLDYGLRRWQRV